MGESAASPAPPTEPGRCPMLPGYNPVAPDELRDPYPSLQRARAEAPVFFSPEFGMWSVTRREDVLAVLRDEESFTCSRALPMPEPPAELRDRLPEYPWKRGLLVLDSPEHRPSRTLIQAPFTPRNVNAQEAVIRARANELLDRLEETGRIEFVNEYAFPLSLSVIGSITGVPPSEFGMIKQAIDSSFRVMSGHITGADRDDMVAASREIIESVDYVKGLIASRRDNPQDDYTSVMLQQEYADGSRPTDEDIVFRLFDLLLAGFETTAQMMAHAVYAILSHPDQWQLLKGDPSLVDDAVEETLRYRTLVKRTFRVAKRDVEVGGVRIPEGALVALTFASANHDEAAYAKAEELDVTRGRVEHLAFGKWQHFCVGAPLARLEMRLTLETLLERFPNVRLGGELVQGPPDVRIHTLSGLELELPEPPHPAG